MVLESHGLAGDNRGRYVEAAWKAAIRDALRALVETGDPQHVDDPDRQLAKAIWPTIKSEPFSGQHDPPFCDPWIFEGKRRR